MSYKKHLINQTIKISSDILDPNNDILLKMSNTELLNEIEKLISSQSDEGIDTDKVEQYLALLQKRAPVMEDSDPAKQWDKLMDAHPMLFDESTVMPKPRIDLDTEQPRLSNVRKGGFRFLRVAGIALVVIFFFLSTANALVTNPIQSLLHWGEGIIQTFCNPSGTMELPANNPSEYHSLEEALIANDIDANGCPTWIPQDYSLYSVRVQTADGIIRCTASYESTRGELIIRITKHTIYDTVSTEEREDGGSLYLHNGIEYYLVSNYDWAKAGWDIGLNSYVISGQISEDELKEIINSIV